MKRVVFGMISLAVVGLAVGYGFAPRQEAPRQTKKDLPESFYEFVMADIEGELVPMSRFRGKVVLVVNVASRCGLTPQYEALEKLYRRYGDHGFVVLGFPANNFGNQEPGTNEEILAFCTEKYDVTFPMFSKISVKGQDIHPLYEWLIAHSDRDDDIGWNFEKFLLDRNGKVIERFASRVKPDDPEITTAIHKALASGRDGKDG